MLSSLLRRLGLTGPSVPARRPTLRLERLEDRLTPVTIYAVAPGNQLLRFDSATPNMVQATLGITGLGANETVRGIDFRPRTGQLVASTVMSGSANSIIRSYRISPLTGVATLIGATAATVTGAGDLPGDVDFNPTVDRLRYVNANDVNVRINPNNGTLAGADTALTPGTDVIAAAYDRNFDRQNNADNLTPLGTTLFVIDRANSTLSRQGGVDGSPSPNLGGVVPVGPLGFNLNAANDGGFDIMDSTDNFGSGTAFAALTNAVDNLTRLYTINLSSGTATAINVIAMGTTEIYGIAVVPDSTLVVGSGAGATGDVRRLNPNANGAILASLSNPFTGFTGGVRVATGDLNRDGIPDFIISAIAPQGHVKTFDGVTGQPLNGAIGSFFAFAGFQGTVNVGSGDVNGDGFDDVLVVANGVNGHVKAFSGKDGTEIASFLAYPGFLGNTTITAADFNNDGTAEIVTAAAINGHLKVFNRDGTPFNSPLSSFLAFNPYLGDVSVAAGDLNGDGIPDVVLSSGAGVTLNVRVINGINAQLAGSFLVNGFGANYTGGGNVGVADFNNDGRYEIAVTPIGGANADVLAFDQFGTQVGAAFPAFSGFTGGATVGGLRF